MGKMPHNEARELLVESYEKTHNAEEIARTFPRTAPGTGKMSANDEKLLHLLLICNFVRRRLQPKIRALMKKAAMRWLLVVSVMKKIGLWATIFYIQRIKIEFL